MDRKKILEEGLLDKYVLGSLTEQEVALVENALLEDVELKREFRVLEAEFELIGFENAVEPASHVRNELMKKIGLQPVKGVTNVKEASGQLSSLQSSKLLVAASLAALFALGSFWLYVQWQSSLEDFRSLEQQSVELQDRLNSIESRYAATQERYVNISTPGVIPLYLKGNEISPQSSMIAYINHENKSVIVNTLGLEPLDPDKSYQLWADVDGEMINMGLLPQAEEYIPVRYIDKAESLNITIEPVGGSDHPTVENLISNIYL